ncbi:MAG: TIGR03936 family radical SAM-associated protein [Planctomycetota bacterium]
MSGPAKVLRKPDPKGGVPCESNLRIRYRVRFGKVGLLRWISHRDLATLWERLARRVQLPLSMTEGFHPKPRIAFPSALALGVESLDEVVEIELREVVPPEQLLQTLAADEQPGLLIQSVTRIPEGVRKAQLMLSEYVITIPASADVAGAAIAIEELKKRTQVSFQRKDKTVTADLAEQVPVLEMRPARESASLIGIDEGHEHDQRLHLSLHSVGGAALKPGDVLDLLGLSSWVPDGARTTRTKVLLSNEVENDDPQWVARTKHIDPVD